MDVDDLTSSQSKKSSYHEEVEIQDISKMQMILLMAFTFGVR